MRGETKRSGKRRKCGQNVLYEIRIFLKNKKKTIWDMETKLGPVIQFSR